MGYLLLPPPSHCVCKFVKDRHFAVLLARVILISVFYSRRSGALASLAVQTAGNGELRKPQLGHAFLDRWLVC
ncbi:hypothetical protein CA51_05900 [Rosistilla oblonga]|nr:hypothetical protein CA51_05900 [Rosistilla oblonga]